MGGANDGATPPSHGFAQAAITTPSQRRFQHGLRALKRPLLAHMHPASCQLFSGTQQLAMQAHVPIFYSCGVIHMHLAMHRKVTQADAGICIRPSTYCCCIHSSKMWHTGVHTPLLQPRARRPWQGLCKPVVHVAIHHHQMSPEQALKTCHAACALHIRRAMLMPHLVDR